MLERDQIKVAVYRSIDRVNELLLDENGLGKDDNTLLVGEGSVLDSMGFVNFIVALEEELAQAGNSDATLTEKIGVGDNVSPRWSTVGELIECLCGSVRDNTLNP